MNLPSKKASVPVCLTLLALLLSLPQNAGAQQYIFTKIADTNDGLSNFGQSPSINNNGTAAFRANAARQTIYKGNGGALTKIVDTADVVDPVLGTLNLLTTAPSINNDGTVSFFGQFGQFVQFSPFSHQVLATFA